MDKTVEILYNLEGQTVETYPPEWNLGVPSAAVVGVYAGTTSNDDAAEFNPSVTADSTSTTVDAASGYSQTNRRKLNLTSTSGVGVGSMYLLENASGQRELVKPVAIATNDYLTLDADLAYDYAAGATFKGLRLSFTVDPTWVATESNILPPTAPSYRVLWAYTSGGATRAHYTYLRLVRQKWTHNLTAKDLQGLNPDLVLDEPATVRGQALKWAIDAADERVRIDVIQSGWKPEQPRDTETLNELRRRASIWLIERQKWMSGEDNAALVGELKKDYDDLLLSSVRAAIKIDIDQGTEGASAAEPVGNLWFTR